MFDHAQSEPHPQPQQEPGRNLTDYEMARWREYFEALVKQSTATEHEFMIEVIGGALAEERIRQREELDAKFKQVPPGPRGEPGPTGKLPVVKAYRPDAVHYEGAVIVHRGALFQAQRDTGQAPPHADWLCLARAGRDGASPQVRGTYAAYAQYRVLDIVVLDGAAFISKRNDPGECPGEGWQLLARQGKRGTAGERGAPGERGPKGARGEAGAAIIGWQLDPDRYCAVPVLSNGALGAELNLRPFFEAFFAETGGA